MSIYATIGLVFPWTLTELRQMTIDELEEWQNLAVEKLKAQAGK